jgi:preprotein translocase subunit SecA
MTPLEKLLNRSDKTEIKKLNKIVDEIDALEEKISSLNDEELKNMTNI